MMQYLLNVVALLLAGFPAGPAQEDLKPVKAGDLTFKIPQSWEIVPEEKTALTALSPQEGPQDTFRENLRVTVTPVGGHPSIDDLFLPPLRAIERGEGPLQLEKHGELTCNGHKVRWMAVRRRQQPAGEEPLTKLEYGLVYRGKAYSINFMVESRQYDRHFPVFDAIVRSVEPPASREQRESTEAYGQGKIVGQITVWVILGVLGIFVARALLRRKRAA